MKLRIGARNNIGVQRDVISLARNLLAIDHALRPIHQLGITVHQVHVDLAAGDAALGIPQAHIREVADEKITEQRGLHRHEHDRVAFAQRAFDKSRLFPTFADPHKIANQNPAPFGHAREAKRNAVHLFG